MFKNYLIVAYRKLARHKLYTIINILGLAMGISACLIIYLLTSFELSYDKFHPDKERIYRIVAQASAFGKENKFGFVLDPLPMTMRNELSGFESVSAFYNYYAKVTIPNANEKEPKKFDEQKRDVASDIIVAEPQYFDIFKYQWLAGNPAVALNEPFKVVLSEKEAKKYFGSITPEEAIGRRVIYNDSLTLTVSGIVKDWGKNTDFTFKDFISFATVDHSFLKNDINMNAWGMWDYYTQGYVKLSKGADPAQVEKQFPAFLKKHLFSGPPDMKDKISAKILLQPLSDVHFNEDYPDAYARKAHLPTLYGLMAIAIFILVIAAINFINLSTAQSIQRAKEIGVRKVLGSNRRNIVIQFLSETLIMTLLAVILSMIITNPIISLMHKFIPDGVGLHLSNLPTLFFLALITVVTALLAGFYPAKVLSSYQPALSLKGQGAKRPNQKSYLHKGLIVFQFTISLAFIIGTIIVSDQMHFVLNKDLGFTKDAIITVPANFESKRNVLAEKIRNISGVQRVSTHMETPTAKGHAGTFIELQGTTDSKVVASFELCDSNYVPLYQLKILAGRNIVSSDSIKEFLVNQTCAKELGFKKPEDAIGKFVDIGMNGGKGPIVGVVNDFHSKSLHESITPFFICSDSRNERSISVKLATTGKSVSDFKIILAKIQKLWKEQYPDQKFEYSFFDETIASLYDKEQKTSTLMNLAMFIAIFISCMGLFGLSTFTAKQRTNEIGIRKVLGASIGDIVSMLSKDFLALVLIAILFASPLAWYFMYKWLEDFAYRINISWWIFAFAGLAAVLIALATVSFQSIKAAIANPVKSLRTE